MFYYVNGKLAYLELTVAVIDCGGVGYKLSISGTTYQSLTARKGSENAIVKLYTYLAVREDDVELFGFYTPAELSTFKQLLTVSGVGPKAALSILSFLTPEKFAIAVCSDDKRMISQANGIGPKTAARIILELKDKMLKETDKGFGSVISGASNISGSPVRSNLSEAIDALIVLGYSRSEAMQALKDIDSEKTELQDMIRIALKKMIKQ